MGLAKTGRGHCEERIARRSDLENGGSVRQRPASTITLHGDYRVVTSIHQFGVTDLTPPAACRRAAVSSAATPGSVSTR